MHQREKSLKVKCPCVRTKQHEFCQRINPDDLAYYVCHFLYIHIFTKKVSTQPPELIIPDPFQMERVDTSFFF